MRIKSRRNLALTLALATAVLLGPAPAAAVQMMPLSLEQMRDTADCVVHGMVISKACLRDEAGKIYTRVEVEPLARLKGPQVGQRVVIVLAGGTLGSTRVTLEGQADYVPGEEIVAFLKLNPRGEGVTIGLAQGKFEVFETGPARTKCVRNLFLGRLETTASSTLRNSAASGGPITLDDLKALVKKGVQ